MTKRDDVLHSFPEVGEKALSVNCLLCKHEDLSLDPWCLHKAQVLWWASVSPELGGMETGGSLVLSAESVSSRFKERLGLKKY